MRKANKVRGQVALQGLAAEAAKLFGQKGTPIPAAALRPLLEAVLIVGESVADQFTAILVEKLADRLDNKAVDALVDKLADKFADKYVEKLVKKSMVTRFR